MVTCGVPQGSILGPLLFLIYVNDMKAAVSCKLLLYADDSALLASGESILEIEAILSKELEAVSEWLVENRLSLHLGKTESILFGSKRRLAKDKRLSIKCNGNEIESGTEVTYLIYLALVLLLKSSRRAQTNLNFCTEPLEIWTEKQRVC